MLVTAMITHDRGAVVLVIASQTASDTHLVGVYHKFIVVSYCHAHHQSVSWSNTGSVILEAYIRHEHSQ